MFILVTGATGFLGSNIARGLCAAGHRVRVLARPASPLDLLEGLPVEVALGDIFDPASLGPAARGAEAVIHAAAQMRGGRGWRQRAESHVLGTRNVLAASRSAGVGRFIYVSSVAALGIPDQPPAPTDEGARLMDETHVWNAPPGLWPYGFAKHEAEAAVRAAAADRFETLSINPSIVFGAGDRNRVSNALIWHAAHGRLPPIIPGGVGVVHVKDVVEGTLAALDRGRAGERYILNGENLTVERLITLIADAAGLTPSRFRLSLPWARSLARAADAFAHVWPQARPVVFELAGRCFYFDSRKARAELGVALRRTAADGAAEAMAWYRRHSDLG